MSASCPTRGHSTYQINSAPLRSRTIASVSSCCIVIDLRAIMQIEVQKGLMDTEAAVY